MSPKCERDKEEKRANQITYKTCEIEKEALNFKRQK